MRNTLLKVIKFATIISFATSITGCNTTKQLSDDDGGHCVWVLPLYKGELKQASEIGIVKISLNSGILRIDDTMIKWNYDWIHTGCGVVFRYPNKTNGYEYHMTPGIHVLELMYATTASRTKNPATLLVNIEAGKVYEITAIEGGGKVNFAIKDASLELKAKVAEEFQSFLDSRAKEIQATPQ